MDNKPAAILNSRIEGGTLVMCVHGVVTRTTMKAVRDEAFRLVVMSEGVKRLLCDMTAATIALSRAEWESCAEEQASVHLFAIPTAFAVPPDAISHAWRYCDRINEAGRACVAFKNAQDAYLWANAVQRQPGLRQGTRAPRSAATSSRPRPASPAP